MKLVKCNRCALINTENDARCRRCKQDLALNPIPQIPTVNTPQPGSKKPFSISQYILVAVIAGVISLVTYGLFKSF